MRQLGVHGGDHEQLLFQLRDDICNGLTAGYRGFERTVHQLGQLLDLDNAAVQCVLNNARVKAALVGNGRRLLVTQVADSRQLLVRCQDSTAAQRVGDIAARVVLLVRVHLDGIIHALHKRGLDKLVRRLVQQINLHVLGGEYFESERENRSGTVTHKRPRPPDLARNGHVTNSWGTLGTA